MDTNAIDRAEHRRDRRLRRRVCRYWGGAGAAGVRVGDRAVRIRPRRRRAARRRNVRRGLPPARAGVRPRVGRVPEERDDRRYEWQQPGLDTTSYRITHHGTALLAECIDPDPLIDDGRAVSRRPASEGQRTITRALDPEAAAREKWTVRSRTRAGAAGASDHLRDRLRRPGSEAKVLAAFAAIRCGRTTSVAAGAAGGADAGMPEAGTVGTRPGGGTGPGGMKKTRGGRSRRRWMRCSARSTRLEVRAADTASGPGRSRRRSNGSTSTAIPTSA